MRTVYGEAMLTIDELAAIPILSTLPAVELARLAKTSADIQLAAGAYVAHEGDTRALFVVISGKLEITKRVGGVERVVGARLPGKIFGEVPVVFGTEMQANCRAAEPSRVLQVTATQYHALSAASPAFAAAVGALALERLGGLQGIAAEPPKSQVTMIGHRWDPVCHDLKRFLSRNRIRFEWVTLDDPDLAVQWAGRIPAEGECPAFRLADDTTVFRPDIRQLAALLGLRTKPSSDEYDSVIIGGGPSGLAAAVYGASEGLRTLVVEREAPGGQAETSSRIENYLGFPTGVSGDELASRALQQATRLGAEILVTRSAIGIDPMARTIALDGGDVVRARSTILATGVSWRRLTIDGFDQLVGKGVFYGAARSEAGITQGRDVHLIGAGNSAGQAALFFANHARWVTLIVRGDGLEKSMSQYLVDQVRAKPNIRVRLQSEVQAVHGIDHLTAIGVLDRATGTVTREDCDGLFVFIGADAETNWLPKEIARDARGYLLTGSDLMKAGRWTASRDPYLLETSVAGIFACGDVRFGSVKRAASAVGEGSMAIAFTHQYLAGG